METVALKQNFKWWAKMGYLARGAVYLIVGGLAVSAALGKGGDTTGSKGALLWLLNQPFGKLLLIIMVIGLFGYASWRLVQAIKDTDNHGNSGKGLAVRGALFVSAITHVLLAIWAISLLTGSGGGSQNQSGGLLSSQAGRIGLGIAGLAVIGAGIAHIIKGWTARFEKYMHIPADKKNWLRPVCRFGLIARGAVWGLIGWFLIHSAWTAGGQEVKGLKDALNALRDSSYGPWLLGIVAAGLFAFGIYSCLEAVYRRISTASV